MRVVRFRYGGRFAHFLRAEANANGLTYPVPPRTVLLGLTGAALGLDKDEPQSLLADAEFAVAVRRPGRRFWHKTNVRKDPPAPLGWTVKATAKADKQTAPEKNFRFPMEYLYNPEFAVWAALPGKMHDEFAGRLRDRRWHYTPCLGLSELLAELEHEADIDAERLPEAAHDVVSVLPQDAGEVDADAAFGDQLTVQSLRMPRSATAGRVFTQRAYWLEHQSRPLPVTTAAAWGCDTDKVVFL